MAMIKEGLTPTLTVEVVEKLKIVNVKTVIDFVSYNPEELAQDASVAFKDILAIRRVLLAQYSAFPQAGADAYEDIVSSVAILSTGSSLDNLLEDGIYTSEVTEIYGGIGSGKTQVCLNLAISVASETGQNVVFFDTGGSFDIQRIHAIMSSRGKDEKVVQETLQHIKCHRLYSAFDLVAELEHLKSKLNSQSDPFYSSTKLLIVDCVAAVISPILGGQQTDGHGVMTHISRSLKTLAVDYALAIVITNNSIQGNKPALGRAWAHMPSCRIYLEKEEGTEEGAECSEEVKGTACKRRAVLTKSTRQASHKSVVIWITDKGLEDKPL